MPYIFGKLWHLARIWAIRKAFQCILQGVRVLLANHTRISPTSDNDSYGKFVMITPLSVQISAKISEFRPNFAGRQQCLKKSGVLSQTALFFPNVTLFRAMFGSAPQKINLQRSRRPLHKTSVVLLTNILSRRDGIWNLAFMFQLLNRTSPQDVY